jgi:predicted ester cyclase
VSSLDSNKALIRRFYEEIDKGNLDAMDDLVAENYVNHDPPPFPGLAAGRAGLKQAFLMFQKATPGRHVIEDQIAEGDKVMTRLRGVGKHEGELAGIAPTGNDLDVKAVAIHRIADGKIVEHWSAVDSATMLAQLGVIPALK